ncbi:hypothetical protein C7S16_2696 [Burkholderia thailandensis]|uniref:Twin-arginine translocation signal domain-containing protein n=1 Tax=Burkholderia thailandensis TaxID=57975 RepID=A0AAW9D3M2_BURTH|nr:hypothetical protein [Burkholderia thailandensis]
MKTPADAAAFRGRFLSARRCAARGAAVAACAAASLRLHPNRAV